MPVTHAINLGKRENWKRNQSTQLPCICTISPICNFTLNPLVFYFYFIFTPPWQRAIVLTLRPWQRRFLLPKLWTAFLRLAPAVIWYVYFHALEISFLRNLILCHSLCSVCLFLNECAYHSFFFFSFLSLFFFLLLPLCELRSEVPFSHTSFLLYCKLEFVFTS